MVAFGWLNGVWTFSPDHVESMVAFKATVGKSLLEVSLGEAKAEFASALHFLGEFKKGGGGK